MQRRELLKQAGTLALGWCGVARFARGVPDSLPNPVGYATISWPQKQFTQALETISGLGFKGVQMLGWVRDAYAGPKTAELRDRLEALKLKPAALSCSGVRLDPAQLSDQTAKVRDYATFHQRLGGLYLQVTDGGRPNRQYSAEQIKALGEQMNALGNVARDSGLELGYHPHFGTLGETRDGLGRVLDATDPRYVKLIADVAHMTLGGADAAEVIRTYHQRLIFAHFKDLRKDVAELARQNRDLARGKRYHFCEIGTGVVNFPAILSAFRAVKFRGWIIIELDGYEPPPGGPAEAARLNKDGAEKIGLSV